MSYIHDRNLELTYSPSRGYVHFVLYSEPPADWGSAINATQRLTVKNSKFAQEWASRLRPCAPNALHVALVSDKDAARLWDACVYDDTESPSAIGGDGCLCWQTYVDPLTALPVAANHYRTVTGNIETWTHWTYSPLALPSDERLASLIIDREQKVFWVRTDRGNLYFLPEKEGAGYEVGYSGGGPTELALMIEKIVRSDGQEVSAGTPHAAPVQKLGDWTKSTEADRTQELTLKQLKKLCGPL